MRLSDVVRVSRAVAATRSRNAKRDLLADLLAGALPDDAVLAVAYLAGTLPQGRIGVGYAALRDVGASPAAEASTLTLLEVERALADIKATAGTGSKRRRLERLAALYGEMTGEERAFLTALLSGDVRQGALGGVMVEALGRAADVPAAAVRRAFMLSGDLIETAGIALRGGADALAAVRLETFRPVRPMLAQPSDGPEAALSSLGEAAFEHKLDGARIQVHRDGDAVRVFTRRLHDVTARVPEVVDAVRALPLTTCVLDGEVIALREDGRPHPFQTTMRRFGRKLDVDRVRAELPLSAFFFDCLRLDQDTLLDRPARERFAALHGALPADLVVPRLLTADPDAAARFFEDALAAGHEGVMAKGLAEPYQAGARGASWLKLKPAHTLDLVVLAAEWGSGRREGWLSNLHLGARDPATNGFVMLGKTFKGLTDQLLQWQTEALLARELSRDTYTVHVRPELVVEIAFSDLQASPRYPGGLALRFARVKRYRDDKTAAEADTIETVRGIYAAQSA